ncbi:CDPK-related kinase 3, partial [Tanacetum coccineum]
NFLFMSKSEDADMKPIDFGLSDFIRPEEGLNDIVGSAYYVASEVHMALKQICGVLV